MRTQTASRIAWVIAALTALLSASGLALGLLHAAQVVDAFGLRLRNETDLTTLADDLVGVVRSSVHPVHVSLWIRPRDELGNPR